MKTKEKILKEVIGNMRSTGSVYRDELIRMDIEKAIDLCEKEKDKEFKKFIEELKEELPDELYKKIGVQGLNRDWKQPNGEETYWELINKIIDKLTSKYNHTQPEEISESGVEWQPYSETSGRDTKIQELKNENNHR